MTASTRETSRQRRADARPRELLDAAAPVFVERGFANTRLDEIARRAGVVKGTIYLYYANKLELFKAVVQSSLVAGIDELAAAGVGTRGTAREQLVRLISAYIERVAGSSLSGLPKLVIAEAGNFPEVASFYFDEVIRRGRGLVIKVLSDGVARGEFRPVDVDYAWRIVVAPLLFSIIWKHSFQPYEPEPLDIRRYLAAQLDMLFNGLAAAKG